MKNEISSITVKIPKEYHKNLRIMAILCGVSMQDLIIEFIHDGFKKMDNKDMKK